MNNKVWTICVSDGIINVMQATVKKRASSLSECQPKEAVEIVVRTHHFYTENAIDESRLSNTSDTADKNS